MSEYLWSRNCATANIVVHEQTEIGAVYGARRLEEILVIGNASGASRRLRCSAVFVFIGAEPSGEWLPTEIARDANGYLLTGTDAMRSGWWPRRIATLVRWKRLFLACWPPETCGPGPPNESDSQSATDRWRLPAIVCCRSSDSV